MVFNLNVGILGHVDSGKTSLAKVLSEIASTAAFDKNPQSQSRGITLDLGFSSFTIDVPEHLKSSSESDKLQFTLVDCPGHASLIKTIIGGAQIIDLMLLVIDVTKGIQTQTAECLVIGELTCRKMIIVLNKIDLLAKEKVESTINKVKKRIESALSSTIFKDSPFVCVSACPGASDNNPAIGIQDLIKTMSEFAFIPERNKDAPFLFAVDHCFGIKGQGTVMTGTILQGQVRINDNIEIPVLNEQKKVKSIQMFKKPVTEASQGDRLGICVKQFDPKLMERGIVSQPGLVSFISAGVIDFHKIKYFKSNIASKMKFHISVGYETVMAKITLFSTKNTKFNFDDKYKYETDLENDENNEDKLNYFALLEFDKPVPVILNSLLIGSKLDLDIHGNTCRLAFWGHLLEIADTNYVNTFLPKLKIYKNKSKIGIVERQTDGHKIIVKNMFKKETNLQIFQGLTVSLSTGEEGVIESSFGKSGKVVVYIPLKLKEETIKILETKKQTETSVKQNIQVKLNFVKYIFDSNKKIAQ